MSPPPYRAASTERGREVVAEVLEGMRAEVCGFDEHQVMKVTPRALVELVTSIVERMTSPPPYRK